MEHAPDSAIRPHSDGVVIDSDRHLHPPQSSSTFSILADAFFAVGGYRLLRGSEPKTACLGELSLARVVIGCQPVVFCMALLVGLVYLPDFIFHD